MKISIRERIFHFKQPAGTSRGIYTTRRSWFVIAHDELTGNVGIGECAPLPDLSCDAISNYQDVLRNFCDLIEQTGNIPYQEMQDYPSMLFGLETAMLSLQSGSDTLFDTSFARGQQGIPINGLVWMGTYDEMRQRLQQKLDDGYRCVKLKIGAIDFDSELALIRQIRNEFPPERVELRVDANGAFSPDEAMSRLRELAQYGIHSIEQPIRQGQWEKMAELCADTPLSIALDEELIGINDPALKRQLLQTIKPQYIILKPSLHGGMQGCRHWIALADELGIGSWITSALESNIGLNAIAQFASDVYGPEITMPQGLGTGLLFTDNIPLDLKITGDMLWRPMPQVHTSGSTGTPKTINIDRRRMHASARNTCDFLGLHPGDTALLCMSTDYIAGKMMVQRAIVRGLHLTVVPTSGHPLADVGDDGFDFAAMVPLQVYNSLQVPIEAQRLKKIRHLLIGGGAIEHKLEQQLRDFPNAVWCSYGMTETLSHIALRRINGPEASEWYTPFDSIDVGLTEDNCLTVKCIASDNKLSIFDGTLVTNDIVEMHPDGRHFKVLGRKDNVICSGGIKLQIEQIENMLRQNADFEFMVTKCPDDKFGEIVVLLFAGADISQVRSAAEEALPKYMRPRKYLAVDKLPVTETGKPARAAALAIAAQNLC